MSAKQAAEPLGARTTGVGARAAFLARAEKDAAADVASAARRLCHRHLRKAIAAFRRAGSYRGEAQVTTWLHRVVVNACLDRIRAARIRRFDALPDDVEGGSPALDEFLATTSWPDEIVGCVLVQEIVVLPPDAESTLDDALAPLLADHEAADAAARAAAQAHPQRRDARLLAAVLREGASLCLLQIRPESEDDEFGDLELRTYPNLAPNLVQALHHTFE